MQNTFWDLEKRYAPHILTDQDGRLVLTASLADVD